MSNPIFVPVLPLILVIIGLVFIIAGFYLLTRMPVQ